MIPEGRTAPSSYDPQNREVLGQSIYPDAGPVPGPRSRQCASLPCHHWLQIPHLWHACVQKRNITCTHCNKIDHLYWIIQYY